VRHTAWFIVLAAGAFGTFILSALGQDAAFRTHMGLRISFLGLGAIALTRLGVGYEIRVNWLTGGVEIVPRDGT